jgi:hypothetical protein
MFFMAVITLISKQYKSTGLIMPFSEALSQGRGVKQAFSAFSYAAGDNQMAWHMFPQKSSPIDGEYLLWHITLLLNQLPKFLRVPCYGFVITQG